MILLAACQPPPTWEATCEEASARKGQVVCLPAITTRGEWDEVSVPSDVLDQIRSTKHLFPARDEAPLPPMFVSAAAYALHHDFLTDAFPELYGTLTWDAYVAMVLDPEDRMYYAGEVTEYIEPDGRLRFGFIVWDRAGDPEATITYPEVLGLWEEMQSRFLLGELMFVPSTSNQREAAATWDAPFAVRGETELDYEAYNVGFGYGTVRRLSLAELEVAVAEGTIGYQDVLVLDEAPFDLERVVSATVTGTRQAALSHLNVRAAARGTPNCYLEQPSAVLAAWDGQLVRFECGATDWSIAPASTEEAEAWWTELRPDPVEVPAPDYSVTATMDLLALPTATVAERAAGVSAYGAKGRNLATLYQRIDPALQLPGFVVPVSWYARFLDLSWDEEGATFAEVLDRWHGDEAFLTDSAVRAERLAGLRAAMAVTDVPPDLLDDLAAQLRATFPEDRMVRFRSSSNAEDGVTFSGAGLYDSASGCLADELDGDEAGPSRCDPDRDEERTVSDALRTVWASLWNLGAWEERAWYGIDQGTVAMGVLVNEQSEDEQANIVAFTGNPSVADPRWLVEAQLGDLDVVAAEAGVWPEQVLLTMGETGTVAQVDRVTTSSECACEVLSDTRLRELGGHLWTIDGVYPVDDEVPEGGELMLDMEWKILEDGRLTVKQVRPFVR